jgi:ABC-type lipoprotein export system ATPase subunit
MIRIERLTKSYRAAEWRPWLDRINLKSRNESILVVRGPQRSGKTTLLLTIGGMLRPTSGRVWIGERDLYALSSRQRAEFRGTPDRFCLSDVSLDSLFIGTG